MAHGVKVNNTGKEDVDKNVILGMGILILQVLKKKTRDLGVQYIFIED